MDLQHGFKSRPEHLPSKTDQSPAASSAGPGSGSILWLGALMLAACLAGPAPAGATGALGAGPLAGIGDVILALALCAAVPAVALAWRRRAARRRPAPDQ